MAKSSKTSKTQKSRPNVDKIVKKVNKEFEKTSTQIEKLVDDALKQLDALQTQVQEPVRKLMKDVEDLREREMKRFHDELDRRMDDFQKIQAQVMDRLGIAQKEAERGEKSVTRSLENQAAETASTAKKAGKTTASKAKATAGKAKSTARKTTKNTGAVAKQAGATATAAAKGNDLSDLTRIKGIGPATARKLQGAGITSINQIANPTEAEQETLNQFSSMKGFRDWPDEAKKLIG
ncbi:Predicted 5' DNA nuclease, flap endonuclease-1-like, helix-3-turn-helix (H3TH) domain [Marinobacter daqiaonensis]|uniref:Predicted 5' DNA nuclease, flap endonuclease-1-like, helix-3-turn-helix (H3TH) domain n=1 Tax=Marinobacter daqiaonensis TaxID=650891 RepID=A0A1I6GRZ4_9GAMM|nr:helix-hairpin-helix domain-containing protein [Marinobacter daqiaonensis]SFR44984.1 Predicted 5' DNA nuclease, flap endonuclease-1-like, helix-3-turn-helix (H3TH) domain [Marinobacter daqiaonensis]